MTDKDRERERQKCLSSKRAPSQTAFPRTLAQSSTESGTPSVHMRWNQRSYGT